MACPTPENIQNEIFKIMNFSFQDLPFYTKVIEPKILKVIRDADKVDMNHRVHKRLTEKYFDVTEFNKTEQGKLILTQIHIAVRACYVLILAHQADKLSLLWNDVSQLLEAYPEFQGQDEQELRYLLQFRNMMRLALLIVPPRMNKKLLINISARLEGSGKEYITGGGQKPCVSRRVLIYEREGNIQAEKRDERIRKTNSSSCTLSDQSEESIIGKKRPQLNPSMKKLKMIRLGSDEAKQLIRSTVIPSSALLTLSRECSKHLYQDDPSFHTFTESSDLSFETQTSSESVLDDLFQFQSSSSCTTNPSFGDISYLVPTHQGSSGVLQFSMSPTLSRNTSCTNIKTSLASSGHANSSCAKLIREFSEQFPPGFISRQQSELLTSLLMQDLSWLNQWEDEQNDIESSPNATFDTNSERNPFTEAHSIHMHHNTHHMSPAAVVLPMLRAVSWDVAEGNAFTEDLFNILSSFENTY